MHTVFLLLFVALAASAFYVERRLHFLLHKLLLVEKDHSNELFVLCHRLPLCSWTRERNNAAWMNV